MLNANYLLARLRETCRRSAAAGVRRALHARVRPVGRADEEGARDPHARPRQAPARPWLPPADGVLPARRRRGAADRADRDRDARDARRVRRRDRGDHRRGRGGPGDRPQCALHDAGAAPGRGRRRQASRACARTCRTDAAGAVRRGTEEWSIAAGRASPLSGAVHSCQRADAGVWCAASHRGARHEARHLAWHRGTAGRHGECVHRERGTRALRRPHGDRQVRRRRIVVAALAAARAWPACARRSAACAASARSVVRVAGDPARGRGAAEPLQRGPLRRAELHRARDRHPERRPLRRAVRAEQHRPERRHGRRRHRRARGLDDALRRDRVPGDRRREDRHRRHRASRPATRISRARSSTAPACAPSVSTCSG